MQGIRLRHLGSGAAFSLMIVLAGCASRTASPEPVLPHYTPTPLPTPTVPVSFAVSITALPAPHRVVPRPRPAATAVVPLIGPYLVLSPHSGPPSSQTITVRGGRLPPSVTLQLVWSPFGRSSPISRQAYTDRHGNLSSDLVIPASSPGLYQVEADYGGVTYAAARYTVVSRATLAVGVASGSSTGELEVSGSHFLPRLKLVLVAYRATGGDPVAVLGTVDTGAGGHFTLTAHKQLAPGEYILRAWSTSTLSAQMAETFFQVVL
jgi:hypothetical protein